MMNVIASFRSIANVAKKEFLHIIRDWRILVLILTLPPAFTLLFGHAFEETAGGVLVPDPVTSEGDLHLEFPLAAAIGYPAVLYYRTRHTGTPQFTVRINAGVSSSPSATCQPRSGYTLISSASARS